MSDISTQKEFISLKLNDQPNKDSANLKEKELNEKIKQAKFIPNNYQQFIANFINPNTNNSRILIKHSVGTGKTSTSIMTALKFIETYKLFDKENSPSVFILGFSKSVFQRELMKRPEFKFITKAEIEKIAILQRNNNTRGTKQDQQELQNYISTIKRKFGNKKGYGHFKFYGYKLFFNRIFKYSPNIKIDKLTEEQFYYHVKNGDIKWNMELLNSMKNGLVICDEAHNLFSSVKKNNWGIAIQSVSDYFKENIRIMYMSATILNNSPTEIVELLNLLSLDKKYKKSDLFYIKEKRIRESESDSESGSYSSDDSESGSSSDELIENEIISDEIISDELVKDELIENETESIEIKLKPAAEKIIKEVCESKISFIEDVNMEYFPNMTILGEPLKNTPYLKFIRTDTSSFYKNTIKDSEESENKTKNKIYLQDIALPNPNLDIQEKAKNKIEKLASFNYGLYDNKEVKLKLFNASNEWKKENEIDLNLQSKNGSFKIVGNFMQEQNIKKYSGKYFAMLKDINEIIKTGGGKIFIYHQYVNMSGAVFLAEMLKTNNITDEYSQPTNNVICSICGVSLYNHTKITKHEYKPARYIIATSEIDKSIINKSLDKYNHHSNRLGHEYLILIGSQVLKEAYDLKCVQNLLIMHRPDNIPTMMQIMGRCRRKFSHIDLPRSQWNIYTRIYTHKDSHEERKYIEKVKDYKLIQLIEKFINESASDLFINYDYMFDQKNTKVPTLGDLPFVYKYENETEKLVAKISALNRERRYNEAIKVSEKTIPLIDHKRFFAYHYSNQEISICMFIIKRLFLINSVYNYDDLYNDIKTCNKYGIEVQYNTYLISEKIFVVSLYNLVYDKVTNSFNSNFIDLLTNSDKLIADTNGNKFIIVQIEKLYCTFPVLFINNKYVPQIDIENTYKKNINNKINKINIKAYMSDTHYNYDYEIKKENLIQTYKLANISQIDAICKYSVMFHMKFIEELIIYIFNYFVFKSGKSVHHDFYFKMLYYYDILNLIIFATGNGDFDQYTSNYLKLKNKPMKPGDCTLTANDELYHEINKNICDWCPETCMNDVYNYFNYAKTLSNSQKVPENFLPIGHNLDKTGKILQVTGKNLVFISKTFKKVNWRENDIIIGYLDKVGMGNNFKFKLRTPTHKMKRYDDLRLVGRGNLCFTKSKDELIKILKSLGSVFDNKSNINNLCKMLQNRLMYLDIEERKKGSNLRYFYYFHELDSAVVSKNF